MKWVLVFAGMVCASVSPGLVLAQDIIVESEWYYDFLDKGGGQITRIRCNSASNDSAVAGFDVIGEWTRYEVTFPLYGTYEVSLLSAGLLDKKNEIHLTLLTDREPTRNQTTEFTTIGYGIG